MRKYALASLGLHGVLVAWWVWSRSGPAPVPVTQPVEVVVRGPSHGRGSGGRRRGGGGVDLRALRPRGDFRVGRRPFTDDGDTSGWRDQDFGAGGGGMKYVAHTQRFSQIVRDVEDMLNYPYPLGKRGIEGTVNARLVFGADGRCAPERLEGGSPYLRVYVLALLTKLCGFEQTRLPEPMKLDLSFAFRITDETPSQAPGQITGNVLLFTRTFPKDWAEYQLGPIRGLWFAPVVSLDWPWVVEHWAEWVDGKDPLADFR